MPGPSMPEEVRSVARAAATAKVEAINELTADGLLVLRAAQEVAARGPRHDVVETEILGTETCVAIFGLPEQPGQEADAVLIAGSEEPALVSHVRQKIRTRDAGKRTSATIGGVARFSVATGDIGARLRDHDVPEARARRPGPLVVLVSLKRLEARDRPGRATCPG